MELETFTITQLQSMVIKAWADLDATMNRWFLMAQAARVMIDTGQYPSADYSLLDAQIQIIKALVTEKQEHWRALSTEVTLRYAEAAQLATEARELSA